MKRFLLFSLFVSLLSGITYAQKVTYKDETIYVDEQPYAIMKKQGTIVPNYSVRTMDNKEIMMVRFEKGDGGAAEYTVSFIGSGSQISMKNELGFGKKLAKEIVENDLIKNGDINPDGEKRYILSHHSSPTMPGTASEAAPASNGPRLVERDRGQDIFVMGKKISQANIIIGNYKRTTSTRNGELYNVYSIYLPDGNMVAEATVKQFNSSVCNLVTMKDNKDWSISVRSDLDSDQMKEIAIYLSAHYYL